MANSPIDYRKYGKKKGSQSMTQFDEKTMQELKEAFQVMDRNHDGVIDKSDINDMYATLGMVVDAAKVDEMVNECSGPINFGNFMGTLAARLVNSVDTEETMVYAFKMFDKTNSGLIPENIFKKILTEKGTPKSLVTYEPLTDAEIDLVYSGGIPVDGGKLDYMAFSKKICGASEDEKK